MTSTGHNRRILLVDDNASIHEDFKKILGATAPKADLQDARAAFFGSAAEANPDAPPQVTFETTSAFQGEEALEHVQRAAEAGEPFAMAFVDVRMPPGWDGVQTIQELWKVDPNLCVVICTAYSDYSWSQTVEALGQSDKLLILKKPFDSVEIRQLAHALVEKWNQSQRESTLLSGLQAAEAQANSYAASLETVNQALSTAKASADKAGELRGVFLERLSAQVNENLSNLIERVIGSGQTSGLEDVLDSSRHLLGVLSEVMDYTQLESGTLGLNPSEQTLKELLTDCVDPYQHRANAKGIELIVDYDESLPTHTRTDPERLTKIIQVLVDNAIRYTERGTVRVQASLQHGQEWSDAILRVDVSDEGPGLEPSQTGRLFEPLAFGSSTGSGVGLALAKRLSRALGGDLHLATNEQGKGCVFRLSLELTQAAV